MFTRRQFVFGMALSSCAVLLDPRPRFWGGSKLASWLGLGRRDLREFTAAEFQPLKGRRFGLRSEQGHSLKVTLREVVEHRREQIEGAHQLDQFSLIFEGPAVEELEQGTFILSHPGQGECELFMVPIGPQGKRRDYQASFSRLV